MSSSRSDLICERISHLESEDVFIATDFLEIADYETVRKTLNRLNSYGKIKKVLRGVYYNPQYSKLLAEYEAPSPHHVAMALARKFNWTIAPAGNTALNQLGLSAQVTAHWLYISDGPYNKFTFGNVELEFKHRSNKEISGMSYKTAMVIQAIKALGRKNIDDSVKLKLKDLLTSSEKKTLLKESQQTTAWVYGIIKNICEEE
jgi:hypothetical protein